MKKAKVLAEAIEVHNTERKELDQNITKEALLMIDSNKKSTVVHSPDWHKGVVGIVAQDLLRNITSSTIVLSEKDDELIGSARSVKGFDLYDATIKMRTLIREIWRS